MSCLSPNEFTSFDSYHNDIGINTINELVVDLHRHEDFIGVERSEILGSTEDDITTELTSFNFGKNAIVNALSSIANNLINLIDVEVDEYAWCDEDESEYSGPRSIAGYPGGVFDHWQWPTIINGIINILQSLLCICLIEDDDDIILPDGEDIIFSSGNLLDTHPMDWRVYNSFEATNEEAYANLANEFCGFRGENVGFLYRMKALHPGQAEEDCNGDPRFGRFRYDLHTVNLSGHEIPWTSNVGYPQPQDIPFELVSSRFDVKFTYSNIYPLEIENVDLSMNMRIIVNGFDIFSGEISIHDSSFFPQGPPTIGGSIRGTRRTSGHWGSLIPPSNLFRRPDLVNISVDLSALPFLERPRSGSGGKSIELTYFVLTLKARRPF